jgi:poly-gamma-glutamate synthesis protein (capsule biosynthesis protein)
LEEAVAPAAFRSSQGQVAVVALTDNEPVWEASPTREGINYVACGERGLAEPYRSRIALALSLARQQADLVIVSAHVGPNWGPPSPSIQSLARELIDMGADLYWGHSNHTPQGIDLYKGKALLYSTGDFLDDYLVDEDERNDLSFLFVVETADAPINRIARIVLHPVRIEDLGVRRTDEQEWQFLRHTMQAKCSAFGTEMRLEGQSAIINVR